MKTEVTETDSLFHQEPITPSKRSETAVSNQKKKVTSEKRTKSKKKNKSSLSPRICFYENEKKGTMVKIYRCQTCPSFVRKNQPTCNTCLGIPNVGKKKATFVQKKEVSCNPKKKANTLTKSIIRSKAVVKSKTVCNPSKKQKNRNRHRVPCIYCNRRTTCKDGICMNCKTANGLSQPVKSEKEVFDCPQPNLNDNVEKSFKKKAIIKLQSVVIKPANIKLAVDSSDRNLSSQLSEPDASTSFVSGIQTRSRPKTPSGLLSDYPHYQRSSIEAPEKELSSIVSDLETLLSNPERDLQMRNDSFYVSMSDLNEALNETNE